MLHPTNLLKTLGLFLIFGAISLWTATAKSYDPETIIEVGSQALLKTYRHNNACLRAGRWQDLRFVVDVGPYLTDTALVGSARFLKTDVARQDIEQRLQQNFYEFGFETYLLLINGFEIEFERQIGENMTLDQVFLGGGNQDPDSLSNIGKLLTIHNQIAAGIQGKIYQQLPPSSLLMSVGNYCGEFSPQNRRCYKYLDISLNHSEHPDPRYKTLYERLQNYFNSFRPYEASNSNCAYFCLQALRQSIKEATQHVNLMDIQSPEELYLVLKDWTLSSNAVINYKLLSLDERVHILQLLASQGMDAAGGLLSSNQAEPYALNVLKYTPDVQKRGMLQRLLDEKEASDRYPLLAALVHHVDDQNLFKMVNLLTTWLAYYRPPQSNFDLQEAILQGKHLRFYTGFWGDVHGKLWPPIVNELLLHTRQQFRFLPQNIVVKPYEYIWVTFVNDFELNSQIRFQAGDAYSMPALLVYLFFDKSSRDREWQNAEITLNALLLATGVGELQAALQAGKRLQTLLAIIDLGLASSDMIVQYGLAESLNKSEEGKRVLEYWNLFQLASGLGMMSANLPDIYKSLKTHGNAVRKGGTLSNQQNKQLKKVLEEAAQRVDDVPVRQLFRQTDDLFVSLDPHHLDFLKNTARWKDDKIIDLFVHFEDGKYVAYVENTQHGLSKVDLSEADLAAFIDELPGSEGKAVRLLSCSDLPAAQKLSTYLPDREIYATDDIVAIHADGGITTVARSGNDTQKWRKLKNGEDIGEAPKPKEPQGEAVEEFVRMGRGRGNTMHWKELQKILREEYADNEIVMKAFDTEHNGEYLIYLKIHEGLPKVGKATPKGKTVQNSYTTRYGSDALGELKDFFLVPNNKMAKNIEDFLVIHFGMDKWQNVRVNFGPERYKTNPRYKEAVDGWLREAEEFLNKNISDWETRFNPDNIK